jgi:hypothetical protein
MFESALTTVTFEHVNHHEYFELDPAHPRTRLVSTYDRQVQFIATPKSMMDFNSQTIYAEVRELAAAFGPVRSFAYIETKGFQAPRFRTESFSVKPADDIVAMLVDTDAAYHPVSDSLFPSIHPYIIFQLFLSWSLLTSLGNCHRVIETYEPAGYKPYVYPAAHGPVSTNNDAGHNSVGPLLRWHRHPSKDLQLLRRQQGPPISLTLTWISLQLVPSRLARSLACS